MPTIGIILGSTRPNRVGDQVAHWVLDHTSRRTDARFELLDLRAPCPTSTSRCRRPVGPASGIDDIGHLGFAWGPADGEPPVVTGMDIARSRQGLIIELHTIVTEIRPAP
ncbi:NADPH-dependent FMN reductase [Streptomyces mauvecolor]